MCSFDIFFLLLPIFELRGRVFASQCPLIQFVSTYLTIVIRAYREDYIRTLEPQVFINMEGFRSIRELAAYLK